MATGFLYENICHPTLAAATAAYWSSVPVSLTPGTTSYVNAVEWVGLGIPNWYISRYTLSSTGVLTKNTQTLAPSQSFPTCDTTETFFDGMTLGWGVVGAMVAAFGIKFLARALNR